MCRRLTCPAVFSNKHTATDTLYFDEVIADKCVYTYIILTNFARPSRRRPRKTTRTEYIKPHSGD